MNLVEFFTSPDYSTLRGLYATALLTGLSVVVMCGILSVLVVVKRLGFVGQGVSHAAFGGIGLAAVLGALGLLPADGSLDLLIVIGFCSLTALGMAVISDRRTIPFDTAIGLFLVGSMALGAVLVQSSRDIAVSMGNPTIARSWESILFGSILSVDRSDLYLGWGLAAAVVAAAWWFRRPLLFWAIDEDSAAAFGVPTRGMKLLLMLLLTLAVVTAMRLAGVVLATALLVLPGVTTLRLTDRLWPAIGLSLAVGIVGLVGGLLASIVLDWQAGPSMVLVMTAVFVLAAAWRALAARRA